MKAIKFLLGAKSINEIEHKNLVFLLKMWASRRKLCYQL